MRIFWRVFFLTIPLFLPQMQAAITPPQITAYDTYLKAEEILSAHIEYAQFDAVIADRTLTNYIKELDPLKCYFVGEEVDIYLKNNQEVIERIMTGYREHDFSVFEEVYAVMLKSIERRNLLESRIEQSKLPKNVTAAELDTEDWPRNESELFVRLQKIRSLQKEAALSLDSKEATEIYFQRILKRRLHNEQDMLGTSNLDQKRQVHSYFLKSFSHALDPHTMYFTPHEAKQFLIQVQQRLFGIGAQLRDDIQGITVVSILPGGPADMKGELKVEDRIVAVNQEPIIGMDISEAVDLIRGPRGTQVILTVIRESEGAKEKRDIVITRDEVILKESRLTHAVEPFGDGVIAHIHLYAFYQDPTSSSYQDVKRVIKDIQANHKLYGVVLDLRNNSGGLLPEAVNISGLFVNKGVIACIQDQQGGYKRLRNLNSDLAWDGPLVVLINRTSASASEIVALSLADYGRAVIVGDAHSYGKGTYQSFTVETSNPEKVNPKGEYKVTRGKYYTVGGQTPQLVGVPSDIEVPGIFAYMEIGEEYAKYPLSNDSIPSQFNDDYSDLHPIYRYRVKKIIGKNPQRQMDDLKPIIPKLATHSQRRIGGDSNYQNFIATIKTQKSYEIDLEAVGKNDLQLEEAMNITKELILYQRQQQ